MKATPILRHNGGIIRTTPYGTLSAEYNIPGNPPPGLSKRPRRCFKKNELGRAKAWLDAIVMAVETQERPLSLLELDDARQALQALPEGVRITDAVNFYLQRKGAAERVTLAEAADRYIDAKVTRNLRPRAIKSARILVNRLAGALPDTCVADITLLDLETALEEFGVAGTTWNNYRRAWGAFFEWCVKRNYATDNPARRMDAHSVDDADPRFFAVDAARAWFEALQAHDPVLIPYYALGFFGGIRSAELARLSGDCITPDLIRVTPKNAKTRDMRNFRPWPTLRAWLEAFPPPAGPIAHTNQHRRAHAVREKIAKFKWIPNGARKSWATYGCALSEDPTEVA